VIDRKFDLQTDNTTLSIPLLRPLDRLELDRLQSKIPETIHEEGKFEPISRAPRNLDEALGDEIPPETLEELPKSFDIVGDIAILELRPALAPFEKPVAQAILQVHSNVKAVYAKTGPIEGPERIRPLRHIAGEARTTTVHREYGCSFKVDLSRAFFSPRLSTEHQRIAQQVGEGERVVDMFAGVGPFTILIAKRVKNVIIDAIDSNPAAAELVRENARINKVSSKVRVHEGDAREVVRQLDRSATRVIMNHPSAARDFVVAACDALVSSGGVIHYYTFAEGEDSEIRSKRELEAAVATSNCSVRRFLGVRKVREVAPMSWQIAIDAEISHMK
jgi:tRNA (guanine37-N1)-methyltransferase